MKSYGSIAAVALCIAATVAGEGISYNGTQVSAQNRGVTDMGTFKYPLRISGMDSRYTLDIEATVDTGSLYTTLPASLLRQLGIEPMGRRRFLVGDGRRIQMDIGEARVTINGENVSTIVAFGEEDAPPVLGAYTLEGFALAVDPVEQRLIPLDPILL